MIFENSFKLDFDWKEKGISRIERRVKVGGGGEGMVDVNFSLIGNENECCIEEF